MCVFVYLSSGREAKEGGEAQGLNAVRTSQGIYNCNARRKNGVGCGGGQAGTGSGEGWRVVVVCMYVCNHMYSYVFSPKIEKNGKCVL